jgi:hypothetical protein
MVVNNLLKDKTQNKHMHNNHFIDARKKRKEKHYCPRHMLSVFHY